MFLILIGILGIVSQMAYVVTMHFSGTRKSKLRFLHELLVMGNLYLWVSLLLSSRVLLHRGAVLEEGYIIGCYLLTIGFFTGIYGGVKYRDSEMGISALTFLLTTPLVERFVDNHFYLLVIGIVIYLPLRSIGLLMMTINYGRTHISDYSMIEALNNVPVGMMTSGAGGEVFYVNNMMEELNRIILSEPIYNGEEFWYKLTNFQNREDMIRIPLEEGVNIRIRNVGTYTFTRHLVETKKTICLPSLCRRHHRTR